MDFDMKYSLLVLHRSDGHLVYVVFPHHAFAYKGSEGTIDSVEGVRSRTDHNVICFIDVETRMVPKDYLEYTVITDNSIFQARGLVDDDGVLSIHCPMPPPTTVSLLMQLFRVPRADTYRLIKFGYMLVAVQDGAGVTVPPCIMWTETPWKHVDGKDISICDDGSHIEFRAVDHTAMLDSTKAELGRCAAIVVRTTGITCVHPNVYKDGSNIVMQLSVHGSEKSEPFPSTPLEMATAMGAMGAMGAAGTVACPPAHV
jgi:hypothetical protein